MPKTQILNMDKQLNIFTQQKEQEKKAHYHSFYRGVKERYAKKEEYTEVLYLY